MWSSAKFNDKTFFFRVCIADKSISFHVTDLEGLWSEEKDLSAIFARAKELNKRIEYDEDTVLNTIKSSPTQWEFKESEAEGDDILNLKYYIDGRPFYFKWSLVKRSANDFKDIVLQTLFVSLAAYSRKTDELLDIIKKKDAEINQYKVEGAVLKRNKVETASFNENEFLTKYPPQGCDAFVTYARENCESLFSAPEDSTSLKSENPQNNNSKLKTSPQKRNRKFIEHSRFVHKIENEKLTYTDSDNTPPTVDDAFEIEQSLKELQRLQKEDRQATSPSQPPRRKVARKKFTL